MIDMINLGFALVTGVPTGLYIYKNLFDDSHKRTKDIKKNFKYFFEEKAIKNTNGDYPKIEEIQLQEWGFMVDVNINKICAYADFEKHEDYISTLFRSFETHISNRQGIARIEIVDKAIDKIPFALIPSTKDKIPVGFDFRGDIIFADLSNNVGLLINGVPGVGKSVLLKQIVRSLRFNGVNKIHLGQVVKSDLVTEGLEVATTTQEILQVTEMLLELINSGVNKEMTYFIIDEFSFLVPSKSEKDKTIKEQILNNLSLILRIGRSENVRLILTTQKCHSEFLPTAISSLLETKLTFKCSDIASSTNVIGTGEATKLNKRQFLLSDGEIRLGRTFDFVG